MAFDDGFDDREAEAASTRCLPRRIGFIETIEDQRQMIGRDTVPAVAHGDADAVRHRLGGQRDLAAFGRVPQRVGRQILHDLNAVTSSMIEKAPDAVETQLLVKSIENLLRLFSEV